MSLFRSAAIVILVCGFAAGLTGCGFRPVYAGGALDGLDGVEVVGSGEERIDFLIETAVREQVSGGSGEGGARLTLNTVSSEIGLGVAGDGRATRYAIEVRVIYTLERFGGAGGEPITGSVSERSVYEAPRDPFALLSARSTAEDRVAQQISNALVQSLSLALRERTDPDFNP